MDGPTVPFGCPGVSARRGRARLEHVPLPDTKRSNRTSLARPTLRVRTEILPTHMQARSIPSAVPTFLAIIYFAGLRPGEVHALRAEDLELPEAGWGTIHVRRTRRNATTRWVDHDHERIEGPKPACADASTGLDATPHSASQPCDEKDAEHNRHDTHHQPADGSVDGVDSVALEGLEIVSEGIRLVIRRVVGVHRRSLRLVGRAQTWRTAMSRPPARSDPSTPSTTLPIPFGEVRESPRLPAWRAARVRGLCRRLYRRALRPGSNAHRRPLAPGLSSSHIIIVALNAGEVTRFGCHR